MNRTFYDPTYLQSLPELAKQSQANSIVENNIQAILSTATSGKTSYLYTTFVEPQENLSESSRNLMNLLNLEANVPPVPYEYIVLAFKKKFLGCEVTYKEEWIDIDAKTRVLKKGILIDWSRVESVDE